VGPVVNGFNGLQDGQILSGKVVIEAVVAGNNIDRVVFQLDGPQSKRYTDRSAPYFFRGDSNGVPNRWNTTRFPDGDYIMTATATDTAGQSGVLSVHFRIANNAQPQPTSTAAPEPTATTMPALSGPVVTGFNGVQEGQTINGTVGIEAVPLTRQAQMAREQGYANGTMDPASLVVAVASLFARTGNCSGQYQLFDGARRYDLALAQGGYADLTEMPNSYYAGSATECTATPQLVAGFQQSALNANLYPQSAKLWMAPAIAGFPTVPVRILARSAFGDMTLELVKVTQ